MLIQLINLKAETHRSQLKTFSKQVNLRLKQHLNNLNKPIQSNYIKLQKMHGKIPSNGNWKNVRLRSCPFQKQK